MASSSPAHPSAHHPPLASALYFERQQRLNCLRHSLNNLLQRPAFSTADLNTIASSITAAEGGGWLRSLTHKWPLLGKPLSSHPPLFVTPQRRLSVSFYVQVILTTKLCAWRLLLAACSSCGRCLSDRGSCRQSSLHPVPSSTSLTL